MNAVLRQRGVLDARLTQLKSTIDALSGLIEEPPKPGEDDPAETLDNVGISDAIRGVLKGAQVGLTPNQLKNKLSELGFVLDEYSNPGAVIYNTLKRLERQGQVTVVNDLSGAIAYALVPSFAEGIARYAAEHPFSTVIPMNTPATTSLHQAVQGFHPASKKKRKKKRRQAFNP